MVFHILKLGSYFVEGFDLLWAGEGILVGEQQLQQLDVGDVPLGGCAS